jgi:hypothetical protein
MTSVAVHLRFAAVDVNLKFFLRGKSTASDFISP